ncbi:hypothetical protein [Variovorax sp. PAMC26660]|uniref:hypothetical protein n=1 Tax=Variovorax sp. PAMC26660 TaxID=2762322 RepID=UPI00164E4554|nr:hypothetical protein [Variovorax sp. PAMC26660]QNK65398.1 hypothetical protein H7F35_19475 [Variovorax sp. PAMC26660]
MSVRLRLVLNLLAWAVFIPVLNLLFTSLERNRILTTSGLSVSIIAGTLVLWLGLIYWRCVPSTANLAVRFAYLAIYLTVALLLGIAALWGAFWVTVLIYGL